METIKIGDKDYTLKFDFESNEFLQDYLEVEGLDDIIDISGKLADKINLKKVKGFTYAGLIKTDLTFDDVSNHLSKIDDMKKVIELVKTLVVSYLKSYPSAKGKKGDKKN